VFANSGLDYPTFLAFNKSGNLFVANYDNNTIEEFNTNGVGRVFASTGLNGPLCIAIQVPEPSTWTLLAVGLIALLPLKRRS
jgi:DNA-binding beta-propeller fold protein YncE